MSSTPFIKELEQKIATKRAQIDEMTKDVRLLQDTLNLAQRDNSRYDSRALPATMYRPSEPEIAPEPPQVQEQGPAPVAVPPEPPVKLPGYKGWTLSFRITKAMIDILLDERPLKRKKIINRLKGQEFNRETSEFENLVSHFLSKDPRFVRCYENGIWTLADWAVAMGPLTAPDESSKT